MTETNSHEKFYFKPTDGKMEGEEIRAGLNPQEYNVLKEVGWSSQSSLLDTPPVQQTDNKPDMLEVDFVADTTESGKDVQEKSLDDFDSLMEVDEELHAYPPCEVVYGGKIFKGFLVEAEKRFTQFLRDATRVRAWVSARFVRYQDPAYQNAATLKQSSDKMKAWTVSQGDTLQLIAHEEYGDQRQWKTIAKANNIKNPRALETGRQLKLPPL